MRHGCKWFWVWVLPIFVAACGSSSGSSSGDNSDANGPGTIPDSLSANYCTATTKVAVDGLAFASTGTYQGSSGSAAASIPEKSTVLYDTGTTSGMWNIFTFRGTTLLSGKISTDSLTLDCELSGSAIKNIGSVALLSGHLYADQGLSSGGCAIDQGTDLGVAGLASLGQSVVEISGLPDAIKTRCGFANGYTKDLGFEIVAKR